MCTLSLIHGETKIAKSILINMCTLNAQSGNKDGFGVFCVDNGKLFKTSQDAHDAIYTDRFLDALDDMCEGLNKVTLLAHTRLASTGFKVISVDNSHPHVIDNILLMHNGTLDTDEKELRIKDKIDSFWFAAHLATIVNSKKLTAKHIVKAYEKFSGKFAFLIYDKLQKDHIFIVKGKTPELVKTRILDDKKNVICHVINTVPENITNMVLPYFIRSLGLGKLTIEQPKSLDDDSIYLFNINNAKLSKSSTEIIERTAITIYDDDWYYSTHRTGRGYYSRVDYSETVIFNVVSHAKEMHLTFEELNYLYYITFGKSLFDIKYSSELATFIEQVLTQLSNIYKNTKGQKKLGTWEALVKGYYGKHADATHMKIYDELKLQFPWFMESKKGLKRVLTSI